MNEEKRKSFKNELFDWAQNIAIILTVVVLLFTFVFRIIGVDGGSMLPTLQDRDWLLVSNLFYEPENGDIVIIKKESFMTNPIVKRVIATEGQTVDIDFNTGEVSVDGVVLDEPYIAEMIDLTVPTCVRGDYDYPVTVPEDCVFVLGDNRNHSSDSRVSTLGMVDERLILGKVILRILPFNSFGTVE